MNTKKAQKASQQKVTLSALRHRRLLWMIGIPLLFYIVGFTVMTWPWMAHFNGYYFADQGDGAQNFWNIWWIHQSVTQLHQSPWHTMMLHWPFGVTLIGQTLNPFNGFVALLLLPFMSLGHAYNIIVIFSFVWAGVTAFWLCYHFSKAYIPSLVGGMVYTFSSYHFAHAEGHMQLVSLEWIPLFILLWWKFLIKPSYRLAIGVAVTLLLVLLCDYYYFLYSCLTALGILAYFLYRKHINMASLKQYRRQFALLFALGVVLVAPLPLALLRASAHTKFTGQHDPLMFSTDILSPFIDGGFWLFHGLTDGYWHRLPANIFDATVYLGISVIVVLLASVPLRKRLPKDIVFWQALILFFGIMSLGPRLLIDGKTIHWLRLPYVIMERVIPGLKLSGMPIRMMVMVTLGSAVIAAMVLAQLNLKKVSGRMLLFGFVAILLFEMWPRPLPLSPTTYPKYVSFLKTVPHTGAVLDEAAASEPLQLYNQTGHALPMPLGYVSRKPVELDSKELPFMKDNAQNKLDDFCKQFKVRYLTAPATKPRNTAFPIIYQDSQAIIYDLKDSPSC